MTITGRALYPAMRRRSSAIPAGTGLSIVMLALSGCLPAAPSAEKSEVRELSYPEAVRAYEKASGGKVWFSWDFDPGGVGLETLRLVGEDHAPEFLWRWVRFGVFGVVRVDGSEDVILAQDVAMASGEKQLEDGTMIPWSWLDVYVHLPIIGLDELEQLRRTGLITTGRRVSFTIETMEGEEDARCSGAEFGEMRSEKTACVEIDGRWGFVDRTGKVVIGTRFDGARPFCEGLAGVKVRGKWGYIDETGETVIEPRFDEVEHFSEGVALVRAGEKWGYLDRTGQVFIKPRFDCAKRFFEGLAAVEVAGKWGYIDRTGRMAIEPRYDVTGRFFRGIARVWANGKWADIDKSGNCVRRQEE